VDPIALDRLAADLNRYWRAEEVAVRLWRLAVWHDPARGETWTHLLCAIESHGRLSPAALLSLIEVPDGPERCRVLDALLGPAEDPSVVLEAARRAVSAVPPPSGPRRASSASVPFAMSSVVGGARNDRVASPESVACDRPEEMGAGASR
jgi:hypothetical protein